MRLIAQKHGKMTSMNFITQNSTYLGALIWLVYFIVVIVKKTLNIGDDPVYRQLILEVEKEMEDIIDTRL